LGFGADLGELAREIQKGPFSRLQLTGDMLEKVASGALERLVQELPSENRRVESSGPSQHNILVVDDSSIIRQMVCKSLSLAGLPPYQITEASDGAEALAILLKKERTFSLVLADIHMPKMTGTQLVAAMASDESLKCIPVVVISSDSNSANQTKLHALGVRALLKKPFRPEQIRAVVHPILTDEAKRL
jgi:two-component system chemotaxis response regulator CheY